jgi:hypothetical protein
MLQNANVRLRSLDAGAFAVAVMVLAEHLLLRNAVKKYYATHLPHYDSIGSYTFAYDVLNAYANDSWWAAMKLATTFGLSLTQPLFAALFAPFLTAAPHSLLAYNSLCLGLLSWSLYALCRALGGGALKGFAAAAVPLVPDAFYWWNGGLQDWQRDPSYLCLLATSFFLFFRHLVVRTKASGTALGIAIALTILSRDSAPGYVLSILGPLFAVWLVALVRAGRLRQNAAALAIPVSIAAAGAAVYAAFMLQHTLARFGNVYIFYSWHSGLIASLRAQWRAPVELLIGTGEGPGASAGANLGIAAGIGLLAVVLALLGAWRVDCALFARRQVRALLLAALWAFLFTVVNLIAVVGIGPLPFQQVKPMFYPTLILLMAAAVALILSLRTPKGLLIRVTATAVFAAGLVLSIPARIAAKTFAHDPVHVSALPRLISLASEKPGAVLAFFWHDGITPDTLRYYLAQRNARKPVQLVFTSRDGQLVDLAMGIPGGLDVLQMQNDLLHGTLCRADFVVVTPQLSWYERKYELMFIFRHGRPVVERLMNELRGRLIFEYAWHDVPLHVYDNRLKSRCNIRLAPAAG